VLVGQPELEAKLKEPQLRQLRQRLTLRAKTHPLTPEETKAYVQQRLKIAGSNGQTIFEPDALAAIHQHANGIPRVVNLLCEHSLVSAFVDQKRTIDSNIVEAVARDFDLNERNGEPSQDAIRARNEKLDIAEALRTLAVLADRLRQSEDLPKERKS